MTVVNQVAEIHSEVTSTLLKSCPKEAWNGDHQANPWSLTQSTLHFPCDRLPLLSCRWQSRNPSTMQGCSSWESASIVLALGNDLWVRRSYSYLDTSSASERKHEGCQCSLQLLTKACACLRSLLGEYQSCLASQWSCLRYRALTRYNPSSWGCLPRSRHPFSWWYYWTNWETGDDSQPHFWRVFSCNHQWDCYLRDSKNRDFYLKQDPFL